MNLPILVTWHFPSKTLILPSFKKLFLFQYYKCALKYIALNLFFYMFRLLSSQEYLLQKDCDSETCLLLLQLLLARWWVICSCIKCEVELSYFINTAILCVLCFLGNLTRRKKKGDQLVCDVIGMAL